MEPLILREQMAARKIALSEALTQTKAQMDQLKANLNAIDGAIQECDFWIHQIDAENEPTLPEEVKE